MYGPLLKQPTLDINILKHYRPVSNLSYLFRLLKKIVVSRLEQQLHEKCLYEPMLSAYRPGHSPKTALLRVTNDLLCALDKQQVVILLLLDLSAAFDTVDHTILLQRLQHELIMWQILLQWFRSYLDGRSQTITKELTSSVLKFFVITINIMSSSGVRLRHGVPQGCVLHGSHPLHLLHQASGRHCAQTRAKPAPLCRGHATLFDIQALGR